MVIYLKMIWQKRFEFTNHLSKKYGMRNNKRDYTIIRYIWRFKSQYFENKNYKSVFFLGPGDDWFKYKLKKSFPEALYPEI